MPEPLKNHSPEPVLQEASVSAQSGVDEFIYLISHDVRSSVRALLELPQWIAEDLEEAGVAVEGTVADSIALMNRHTRRLDRMLVDLLTYSRVGRLQTTRELDLGDVLDCVTEMLPLPEGFKLEKKLTCASAVLGDRDIQTLLSALIGNAVKHHDRTLGRIVVASRREGAVLVLTVTDDGPGIPSEFHERVFQPMTTLRPRDDLEGTGLGLATVRKIAASYGGTARLLPTPQGRGASVEVRLTPAYLSHTDWVRPA